MMLGATDRETFQARGLVHLRRFASEDRTKLAREAVIAELTRLGARTNGKWNAARFPKRLRHLPQLDGLLPSGLEAELADLAGSPLTRAEPTPQLLLTAPQRGPWAVPCHGWHLDVAAPLRDALPGIQVFVLVDDVDPGGGGTVAIAGSHALHGPSGRAPISALRVLQADPAFAPLFAADGANRERYLTPQQVEGVSLQVLEMCGRAGDAYLMDMRVVHAAAPNAAKRPRMMLTSRYLNLAVSRGSSGPRM